MTVLLAAALCAAATALFWPLLQASFYMDDFVRLYDLANYGLVKLLISPHGGHLLLSSNGVYALFWTLFGLESARWFAAVLGLHALNTSLLFHLLRRLGCRNTVAVAMAALWALCPAQAAALGWMAVFGHVLLGTIMLVLVGDIAGAATRGGPVRGWRISLWWLLALLAATSFASGLGTAMALPLAAVLLLPAPCRSRSVWLMLGSLLVVVPLVYVAQHLLYARLFDVPVFMKPVLHLDPRNLPREVARMGWLCLEMLAYSFDMLLLGGRWSGSSVSLDPRPWVALSPESQYAQLGIPAVLLASLTLWGLWRAPRRRRAQALALATLTIAGPVTLAAGGILSGRLDTLHLLGWNTSNAVFRQAMQLRYQYLPTLFLAALLALSAETAASRSARWRRATEAILLIALAWLAFRVPADRIVIERLLAKHSLHRRAIQQLDAEIARSQSPSPVYLSNGPIGGGFLTMHEAAFPGRAALCVIYHPDGVVRGKTVRFVERDPVLLAFLQAQTGTPIARLVVSPNAVAGKPRDRVDE